MNHPLTRHTARRAAGAALALAAHAAFARNEPLSTWPMVGGSAARTGVSASPGLIDSPSWVVSHDQDGRPITFVGQAGVVVSRDVALAIGSVIVSSQRQHFLYAADRPTGLIVWSNPITPPTADSWSPPVIDEANRTVITTTGRTVAAADLLTGSVRWSVTLDRPVVNASAVVTSDLGVSNRVFVTQYDGFGNQGELTCINADPRLGIANPFDPGQVVWSVPIGGSSGNSPAYAAGVVFCSAVGEPFLAGRVHAFDARAVVSPEPIWTAVHPGGMFFGGVSLHADGSGLWLYAGTYDYWGGVEAGTLVKINALTGQEVWSIPCNRTSSTPVVLGDGRLILSGGIWGYGTVPSVELFVDLGSTAYRAWHSALDTWIDANQNGQLESGEFLSIGGWSHVPVAAGMGRWLLAGTLANSASTAAPCTDLRRLDLDLLPPLGTPQGPADRSFVAGHHAGAGSTPAIADDNVYTIGASGLAAFGPPPSRCDVNGDGLVDIEDLIAWDQQWGARDINLDGQVDLADRVILEKAVRRDESKGIWP
ncbi:MAG: PQQ-binding-like beta-propeller repeat protein [Phycisphaeraceae bacterium]|nr:PQQ-binding-like beta-propeller repeat protein [Phycisphaerae bacterium]MBX3392919.1 PQQ-binding-like beta-propeller repeat protein [Phycisphaeraceae bacterium]